MQQKPFSAGLCPDPLGKLTMLPKPSRWIWVRDPRSRRNKKGREEHGGRKGVGLGGKDWKGIRFDTGIYFFLFPALDVHDCFRKS